MTQEEKAKAYDEALSKASHIKDDSTVGTPQEIAEYLFPELKESEDERIRQEMVEFLDELWHLGKNTNFDRWGKADCAKWIAYLEKQKDAETEIEKAYKNADQVQYRKGFEDGVASVKPAEWSEEDKEMLEQAIKCVNNSGKLEVSTEEIEDWLKSLRPQSHWKPSEEQMEVLNEVIGDEIMEDTASCDAKAEVLNILYADLQKLL